MNSPLFAFDKSEPTITDRRTADIVFINPASSRLQPVSSPALALEQFRYSLDHRDNKALDFLLIGVLSILVHTSVLDYFKHSSLEKEELQEPVKIPTKVQISFVQPKPKPIVQPPKPIVQPPPPPPPPKAVAIKKPPKPKVKPKPTPVVPAPVQTLPRVVTDAPVSSTAAPVVAPPPPPKQEKITQPSSGADYLNNPQPDYPEMAMERGWEGKVLMKVHVLANGKPDSVAVARSSGHDVLDDEAVRTVKNWTFVPGKRGSTPIDGWVTVPISFNLQN